MLEPAETRRKQDPVDRNGLAQKNTGSHWLQKVRNETVRNIQEQDETIIDKIQKRRLTWFGHVERMEDTGLPHKTLHCYIEGVRSRGRQRKAWVDNMKEDLEKKIAH